MHPKILELKEAVFVVIDMQESFRGVIPDFAQVAANINIFLRGAQLLDLPVVVTEQYPQGLGSTAEEIKMALHNDTAAMEKTTFSSCGKPGFVASLKELEIKQVIVAGIEAHICVNQTVHDLLDAGFAVHVLTDCVSTRYEVNRKAAFDKMFASGAVPSTVEMALFELMRDSKHHRFREIQALVK